MPDQLVTIVVAVYNGERFLQEALESAFAQDYGAFEVVVVDDGSTDRSASIARSFPAVYVRQENRGLPAARNTGLELARGELIAFLDADDRFPADKLERQLATFDGDPSLDIVFGHVTEFLSPDLTVDERRLLRAPKHNVPWPTPNLMLVRREAFFRVGEFSTDLKVGIGVDWYARACELGLKSVVPPVVVLERRLHAGNNGIRQRDAKPQYLHVVKAALDRRRLAAGPDEPS
jgi:glycosyltransferase involved in cell wall biosynthesis